MMGVHDIVELRSYAGRMSSPGGSSAWLSYDMARALAAAYPPLNPRDVVRAADELAIETNPVAVIRRLLRHGSNLLGARGVVAALSALRDYPG